jgi:hypothetical protein
MADYRAVEVQILLRLPFKTDTANKKYNYIEVTPKGRLLKKGA